MEIKLKNFDINNDTEYNYFTQLYTMSFPIDERRPISNIFYLLNNKSKYIAKLITNENNDLLGFLTYWIFDDFIFAEHLAVDSKTRGTGIGSKTMKLFMNSMDKPIIMEIEVPQDEITIKRLHFYLNLNCKYWENIEYIQPAYTVNTKAIPMKLLTVGDINLEKEYLVVKNYIYKHVYNAVI